MNIPNQTTKSLCTASLIFLSGFLLLASGCSTAQRNLLLTEVGKQGVELYLDEPSSQRLRLGDGMRLEVRSNTNGTITKNDIGLGTASQAMQGGGFLIVWEGSNYTGPPVAEDYPSGISGAVPGIKVADKFFGDIDSEPSEIRLIGERNRVSGLLVIFPMFTADQVDDVIRFGQPPADRPVSGGTFAPNGSLIYPTGSGPLQRWWGPSGPIDTDQETDWTLGASSWGQPTP